MNEHDFRRVWAQVTLSPEADERIRSTLEHACLTPETAVSAPRRFKRKISRTAVAILAAVLLLTVTALAASHFSFSEISEGYRLLMDIDTGAVPEYIHYDAVTEAYGARFSDVEHVGKGEVYVTAGYYSVYSENFLTVDLSLWRVNREQYEDPDYVWRVQLPEAEDYIAAQPISYYEYRTSGGSMTVRAAILKDSIPSDSFRLTVFGGYETDDGTGFEITRVGIVSVDVPAQDESIYLPIDATAFYNKDTGEEGLFTGMELHTNCLILYCHIDGIYDLGEHYDLASQKAFIVWAGSFHDFIWPVTLTLTGGETIDLHFDEDRWLPDDTLMQVMELREPIDISTVESVTMGDVTYPIPKA